MARHIAIQAFPRPEAIALQPGLRLPSANPCSSATGRPIPASARSAWRPTAPRHSHRQGITRPPPGLRLTPAIPAMPPKRPLRHAGLTSVRRPLAAGAIPVCHAPPELAQDLPESSMQPPPSTIPGLPLGLPTKPTFPSTLPKVELTEDERRAPYGLTKKLTPAALKSDLSAYEYFCKLHVNGDRGPEYVHAVQSTTITKTLDVIRGYLGYVARQFSVPAKRLRLLQYGDPTRLAFFFAFCLARKVQRGHMVKQLSVAKKVNDFLASRHAEGSEAHNHHHKVKAWLAKMETQLSASMPSAPPPAELPRFKSIKQWANDEAVEALSAIELDMASFSHLTASTARKVHDAILIHLVCGISFPPVRLDLIKNLRTPAYNARNGCSDPDCLKKAFGQPCKGNRVSVVTTGQEASWHYGYPAKAVRLEIVHGKNDRRQCREMYNVAFTLPEGSITQLFLAHIFEGQHLLTHHLPYAHCHMFVTKAGASFANAVFTQYWAKLMRRAGDLYGLEYFPPSLARTIFVEDYSMVHGSSPDMLEGAAAIMGNTVGQWAKSYNPSKRRRAAQAAVAHHHEFTKEVDEAGEDEDAAQMQGVVEEDVFDAEDEEMGEMEEMMEEMEELEFE